MQKIFYLFVLFSGLNIQAQEYNIVDFGAKPEKGFLNTEPIQSAIDKCSETGGRVVIPADTFMTGSLEMKDNFLPIPIFIKIVPCYSAEMLRILSLKAMV